MIPFALAVLLLAVGLPRFGDSQAIPTRFFLCPNYRDVDSARQNDPLWLLEKDDEWIPFRANVEQEQLGPSRYDNPQPKTFRCIFYYLAAFSHFMMELFTPAIPVYYVYPHYRVDGQVGGVPQGAAAEPPRSR